MAKKKGTGVSPITNRIYYGTQDTDKHMWIGQKTDITDSAIASVFEWFMGKMEGKEEYSIAYPNADFELVMRRKQLQLKESEKNNEHCNINRQID